MMLILFHKQKATKSLDMPDVYTISYTHKKINGENRKLLLCTLNIKYSI